MAANTSAKITRILFVESGDSGFIYIYPEGGINNPVSCAKNGDYFSYKMNRPMAQEYLSGLMLAFASQKKVLLRSSEDCIDQENAETLSYFYIDR